MPSHAKASGHFCRPTLNLGRDAAGVRSLPQLIHFNAQHNPKYPFCIQAEVKRDGAIKDTNEKPPYETHTVTMETLKISVDSCADWINHGLSTAADETMKEVGPVAIIMESNIGLFIYLAALLELGIPALLLSARLSGASVRHLLLATNCRTVLLSKRFHASLEEELSDVADMAVAAPHHTFLEGKNNRGVSRNGALNKPGYSREALRYPLILHSSGTTGLPKPIPVSGQYPIVYAACHEFPEDMAVDWSNMSTLPLYHGFGLLAPCLSLSVGLTCCFPPSSMVPAAQSTTDLLQVFSAGSLMTVPSIINDILALPKDEHQRALRFLKGLRFVAVGGGALEAVSAATLSDLGVKLLNHYGVTEIGAIAPIFCPGLDYDWHFLRLRTDLGLKLQPIIENGTAKTSERFKLVGIPIGSEEPFEIQDEMERNPHSSRDEVRVLGRRDDLIVLKTGEKVLGRLLEDNLTSDPEIQSAVCVGHGYLEILVLIEASPTARLKGADILDHAWEIVQRVNPQLDQHARVSSKSAIFLKPSGRDIPRSDKGSVMRREVHELFRHEIEAAYTSLEVEQSASVFLHRGNIKQSIRSMVERIVGDRLNCSQLGDNDDFYELGMDSLQSIRLARLIGSSVRMSVAAAHNGQPTPSDFPGLSADYIYRHPSIKALAAAVKTLILGGQVSTAQERDRAKEIRSLLGDLTTSASLRVQRPHHNQATHIVLLTGSTGNLGAHVLNAIVRDRSVREVICLMRPLPQTVELSTINASRSRQEQALSIAGLKLKPVAWDKVRFLESGQGSNYLGSDPYALADLTQSVTHIIHMAWPMDFNRKVESFRPHLEAVKSLTNLARAAHQRRPHVKVRLLFTSSIAVARHYGELMGRRTVPEASIADPLVTMELGYAEAKWICEQMLAKAGTEDSEALEAITVRVGQLSGPERRGVWKTEEHIPALLKTSQAISAFPRLDGTMSWLPVDRAARSLAEIALAGQPIPASTAVLHLENPVRQPMADFAIIAKSKLGIEGDMMEFEQWVDRAVQAGHLSSLEPFFRKDFRALGSGAVVLETARSRSLSRTLRGTSAVSRELMVHYLDRWKQSGFLR